MTTSQSSSNSKNPMLIFVSISIWVGLIVLIIWPWIHIIDQQDLNFSYLAHINAGIWWIILLWALHHMSYQVASLFQKKKEQVDTTLNHQRPSVAIFYLTCDDFNPDCCMSCINQEYPSAVVFICDDSKTKKFQDEIDRFCSLQPGAILIRRTEHIGYKAGNINNAIKRTDAEWILLVDADQTLPKNYLTDIIGHLTSNMDSIAFVQGAHKTADLPQNSLFQQALSPEVGFFYSRDLPARSKYGFVPLLGHGALIRASSLEKVGGVPEVVSEDFAFAMKCINKGMRGHYLEHVESEEAYPYDFGGFLLRLRKFSGGTAELVRQEITGFLFGEGSLPEKWDMVIMLAWYLLMPLLVINGFLGSYVVHRLWIDNISYLHPVLPYLYIWMLLANISLSISSTGNLTKTLKFYFWSSAIYIASLPLASASFLGGLVSKPKFRRTPKNGERTFINKFDSVFMVALGALAIYCSFRWLSPYSPLLAGQGIAYLSFPFYNSLNLNTIGGKISRFIINIPGLAIIFALFAMWQWGRY